MSETAHLRSEESGMSAFDLHHGNTLKLVANTYPTLHKVLLEEVQNAVDAGAKRIDIKVDQVRRTAEVCDNGVGASQAKFEEALTNVCHSIKGKKDYGQFGIGLISPLGKCDKYTFTSCSNGHRGYLEWEFITEDIRKSVKINGINYKPRPDLVYSPKLAKEGKGVWWSTRVLMNGITTDSVKGRVGIDSISEDVVERFGVKMLANGVVLNLIIVDTDGKTEKKEVIATHFQGSPLKEETRTHKDCGEVSFRLFITRRKASKITASHVFMRIKETSFRLPWHFFAKSAKGLLPDEIFSAFQSGVFEGEILISQALLHETRSTFNVDDNFLGVCQCIESWYEDVGKEYFKEQKTKRQEARYQQLGIRSMKVVEAMLKDPETKGIFSGLLGSIKKGSIGEKHSEVPGYKTTKQQTETAVAIRGGTGSAGGGGSVPGNYRAKPLELKGHHPLSVAGPRGTRRNVVRGNSLGIQLVYDPMEGSEKLWEFEVETGTLRFNIRHPSWVACDGKDRSIMRLQEFIIVQALALHSMPKDWRDQIEIAMDAMVTPYVFMIQNGDALAGRRPSDGRKKK